VSTSDNAPAGEDLVGGAGLRSARPPSRFRPVRRWVIHTVAQLHGLREAVREETSNRHTARADRRVDRVAHDLVLVASELATNAIRHGHPPTIIELLQDEARFILTVADHDLGSAPRLAGDRRPGEGGFGLQIVQRLSRDVGWYRTDTVKVVWAEVGS
jgi:serine/threonine-protein kinase RsbW